MSMIIVIDPNYYSRMIICYHLKQAGYLVHDAPSIAILEQLETAQPDLVIADQQACEEDAEALLPLVQRHLHLTSTPLLILMNEDRLIEDQCEFVYVRKPMLHNTLMEYVQKLVPQV